VRAHDRALQGSQVLLAHPGVGERAETGVDPVDRPAAGDGGGHDGAAGLHPGRHIRAELGACGAGRHVHDIRNSQRVPVDDHCSHG
jgi:hypothetical protein